MLADSKLYPRIFHGSSLSLSCSDLPPARATLVQQQQQQAPKAFAPVVVSSAHVFCLFLSFVRCSFLYIGITKARLYRRRRERRERGERAHDEKAELNFKLLWVKAA